MVVAVTLALYEFTRHAETSSVTGAAFSPYLLFYIGARLFIALVAGALLFKPRLTSDESRLFNGLIGLALDILWDFYPDGWPILATAALANGAIGFGVAQLLRYAAGHLPPGRGAGIASAGAVVAGVLVVASGYAPVVVYFGFNVDGPPYDRVAAICLRLRWALMLAMVTGLEAIAVIALRHATEGRRARLLVAAIGFAPLVVTTALHAVAYLVTGHEARWAANADALGNALSALILLYGAGTRRLVDVEYVVNAAIAVAVTGALLTTLAFLAEHFVAPWLESRIVELPVFEPFGEQIRQVLEIGVAFVAFLCIDRFHEWSTETTRDVIFHHRAEHLAGLRRLAETIVDAAPDDVAQRLVAAAIEDAGASAAALYLRKGSRYRRVAARGDAPETIPLNDPRVPQLRRPRSAEDGSLTLPMPIGTMLTGFFRCDQKRTGTTYAPDEISLLGLAAREAGIALRGVA